MIKLKYKVIFSFLITQMSLVYAQPPKLTFDSNNILYFKIGFSNTSNAKDYFNIKGSDIGSRISGMYIGIESNLNVTKNISLCFGIHALNKGVKSGYEAIINQTLISKLDYRYTLSYIELPIYIQYKFKFLTTTFGIDFSHLIRANYVGEYYSPSAPLFYFYASDVTKQFNRYDFGLRIGLKKNILNQLALELVLQKNMISPYLSSQNEISKQQTVFIGVLYNILQKN